MECGDVFLDGSEDKQYHKFEASSAHAEPQRGVTADVLIKVWRISLGETAQTLHVKTQSNKHDANAGSGISRRFSTNDRLLQCKRISSLFYMDTFFSKAKSKGGFAMMQVLVGDKGFVKVY